MGKDADPSFAPFNYQQRLAEEPWHELLDVPTGMGKTAAVTLAWLWKRGWHAGLHRGEVDDDTPRRLIWCLPMRVLVEQTEDTIRELLSNLGILKESGGEGGVSVHVLMGGATDLRSWAEFPEDDMIVIGTQDMLLSRALMRGYGMSRFQWPIHFALLHNDCHWVFDEIQLMGAGLTTSTQLEAFRRNFPLGKASRSLWISATLNREWLNSVDFSSHLAASAKLTISDDDRKQAIERLDSVKHLEAAKLRLEKRHNTKAGISEYIDELSKTILSLHDGHSQTLVIVNRVERAQKLFRKIRESRPTSDDLLIHSRFRAKERREQSKRLRAEDNKDRVIIATQAIEAGVDISSKTLITEVAPWASLVQRFGRCNRYGEHNDEGASIYWIDIEDDADLLPYAIEDILAAREKLKPLETASPQSLPATDELRPVTATLRRKDLLDLFNTDPDLSGFDVDVGDYIRDSGSPGIEVFWRDFTDNPNEPKAQSRPDREELCPASLTQAKELLGRQDVTAWYWDSLDRRWTKWDRSRSPRPGMTLLLPSKVSAYDPAVGLDPTLKTPAVPLEATPPIQLEDDLGGDWRSLNQMKAVLLADHLGNVASQADRLCRALGESHREVIVRAGRWHDLGKLHEVFQTTMKNCELAPNGILAKSPCNGRHDRKFFRHELASMLAWLAQHDEEPDANLIAYLILAHHGKVRLSLRAMPGEEAPPEVTRFARGVWEGDTLNALEFDGEHSGEVQLCLSLMELGYGDQGASWTERAITLLNEYGPFQLAWLETLVRLADWRASALEQEDDNR